MPNSPPRARSSPGPPPPTAPRLSLRLAPSISACRGVAGDEPGCGTRMAAMLGLAIGAEVAQSLGVRPQKLLLSRLAEGLPISQYELPVVQQGQLTIDLDDGSSKVIGITRAHLEEDAGKSLHRGFSRSVRDRPEPCRYAAAGNRLRAGYAFGQGGGGVYEEAAPIGGVSRYLRRQHAGRFVPLRRQRVGTAQGRTQARHPRRTQESQLLPLRRTGDRV